MKRLDITPAPYVLLLLTLLTVYSCSTSRHVTQLVERTSVDTIYLSNVQYDSIYIFQERTSDYHMNPLNPLKPSETDTVFIKDVSVEYRYRLLRDTVYKTQIDSIPYQVTVTEVKEITRPLTLFDHLTRFTFWFAVGALLTYLIRVIIRFKKSGTIR